MATITVQKKDEHTYEVTVKDASTTTHTVTLTEAYRRKITSGNVDAETLIGKSFEFLLEREPNTSILSRFELPVIGRYFPEYEREMAKRLQPRA